MAIWTNLAERARNWLLNPLLNQLEILGDERSRLQEMMEYQAYVDGHQRSMLPIKSGKPDDNLVINLARKVVNKSVAMLFGGEVQFDLGEEEGDEALAEQEEFLDMVWEANKKSIFLQKLGRTGGSKGTVYVKITPGDDGDLPRLVSLDPVLMRIETDPQDVEDVQAYVQQWVFKRDGKDVLRRETTQRVEVAAPTEGEEPSDEEAAWEIVLEENSKETRGKWVEIERTPWDYPFPPIIHGQNLPVDNWPYGESDLVSVIGLQDRVNYVASNISKIIRYHSHPKTVGTGFGANDLSGGYAEGSEKRGGDQAVEAGSDQMLLIPSTEAKVFNVEMQSELAPTMGFLNFLIQTMYDVSDTVNLSNVKDKLGQLTNFGLRVLYQDALEKLATKRGLYGDLLTEVNRRLLYLQGREDADGGQVVWPADVMPENEKEESAMLISEIEARVVSRQTARRERGYDHEQEKARIQEESAEEPGALGAQLIDAFNRG